MAGSAGFFASGLVTGTVVFAILGSTAMACASMFFTRETPNISKSDSRKLGMVVVWTSTFCMWLLWACVYMHQMVPLIEPVHREKVA
mmetsp:Transcript_38386/g.105735  ORF Transcript_38386/g.105735 Transcript_38386/m.105735 type:complete len:87 (+) Transcript_38386:122-382(+)